MANGYYDFDAGGKAVPFVTAGLGLARNAMDDWTRINPDADRTSRSFEGGSETSLAWSIGVGVAVDVGPVLGSAPAKLELAWRYFDLGSVSGGYVPLPGSGAGGQPVTPLNFDVTTQVISLGLRIPL
jgi:opacity protein-like surface antigen